MLHAKALQEPPPPRPARRHRREQGRGAARSGGRRDPRRSRGAEPSLRRGGGGPAGAGHGPGALRRRHRGGGGGGGAGHRRGGGGAHRSGIRAPARGVRRGGGGAGRSPDHPPGALRDPGGHFPGTAQPERRRQRLQRVPGGGRRRRRRVRGIRRDLREHLPHAAGAARPHRAPRGRGRVGVAQPPVGAYAVPESGGAPGAVGADLQPARERRPRGGAARGRRLRRQDPRPAGAGDGAPGAQGRAAGAVDADPRGGVPHRTPLRRVRAHEDRFQARRHPGGPGGGGLLRPGRLRPVGSGQRQDRLLRGQRAVPGAQPPAHHLCGLHEPPSGRPVPRRGRAPHRLGLRIGDGPHRAAPRHGPGGAAPQEPAAGGRRLRHRRVAGFRGHLGLSPAGGFRHRLARRGGTAATAPEKGRCGAARAWR